MPAIESTNSEKASKSVGFCYQVYANDLNPRSYFWLKTNIKLNKVASRVLPFNLDARHFLRMLCGAGPLSSPNGAQPSDPAAAQGEAPLGGVQLPASAAPESAADAGSERPAAGSEPSEPASADVGSGAAATEGSGGVPEGFVVPEGGLRFHHAVMNLPASATEFLDAFRGAIRRESWEGPLPLVHCYTFGPKVEGDSGKSCLSFLP